MAGKRDRAAASKDAEIEALATELDGLLDQLAGSVGALNAILTRPKQPPASNVKVVPSE